VVTEKRTARVLMDVLQERERQDRLRDEGRFRATLADSLTHRERLTLVAREFGEVARATPLWVDQRPVLTDLNIDDLRVELVQLAAVAVAWVEGIDNELAGVVVSNRRSDSQLKGSDSK
jgi:hypothetical protein